MGKFRNNVQPLYASHFVDIPRAEVTRLFVKYGTFPLCLDLRSTDLDMVGCDDPDVFASKVVDEMAYKGVTDGGWRFAERYGEEHGSSRYTERKDGLWRVYRDIGGRVCRELMDYTGMRQYMADAVGWRLVVLVWLLEGGVWTADAHAVYRL